MATRYPHLKAIRIRLKVENLFEKQIDTEVHKTILRDRLAEFQRKLERLPAKTQQALLAVLYAETLEQLDSFLVCADEFSSGRPLDLRNILKDEGWTNTKAATNALHELQRIIA